MTTRSDRTTGRYRAYKGSGPIGHRPRTRLEREEDGEKPAHGRGSGTPYEKRPAVVRRRNNMRDKLAAGGMRAGPHPHPTKKGPGRF